MDEQRSLGWFRARLGTITGSQVGLLMKSSRSKSELFGDTAKSYIYSVAAERDMNPVIVNDDELFEEYLKQVDISSKAMRWGNEQEENARALYEKIAGRHIVEVGSCKHPTIENFASSPDGFFYDENTGEKGCLEIKCPSQAVFMRYKDEVEGNSTLLTAKSEYFFQCQSHMMVTGAQWCDFVVYCPFQQHPIHIVRITPDYSCFAELEKRINAANDIINQIIDVE